MGKYVPKFVVYEDDDCPGPSSGTSNLTDSNVVVCHIFPMHQQYVESDNEPVLYTQPSALVEPNCLRKDLAWFPNTVLIYGALLYGRDCGLTGHTADVEGFAVAIRYTGIDDGVAWRNDINPNNWLGHILQTTSHAGTICEGIETFPYRTSVNPNGKDTIYPSPDKHGNYLTEDQCSSGFFCDPACDDSYQSKRVKLVNVGEENYPATIDLGTFYSGYAGESPWSDVNFLDGNAGTIKEKMLRPWRDDFLQPQIITTCEDICAVYNECQSCGTEAYNACISSCQTINDDETGCNAPQYNCTVTALEQQFTSNTLVLYPNPTSGMLTVHLSKQTRGSLGILDVLGREVWSTTMPVNSDRLTINIAFLPQGLYFIRVANAYQTVNYSATFMKD
jgi:hypothetical protein